MGRILSALLILLLAVSHGPMSAAVPHADGTAHAHVLLDDHDGEADHHGDADHHEGDDALVADTDAPSDATGTQTQDDDTGKATHGLGHHVHVVTDGVPTAEVAFLDRTFKVARQLPVDDAFLRSATLDPLAEPPSA